MEQALRGEVREALSVPRPPHRVSGVRYPIVHLSQDSSTYSLKTDTDFWRELNFSKAVFCFFNPPV